jgi:hypothetical protein
MIRYDPETGSGAALRDNTPLPPLPQNLDLVRFIREQALKIPNNKGLGPKILSDRNLDFGLGGLSEHKHAPTDH